jgi:uncharacterized alpha-E superfamily protein
MAEGDAKLMLLSRLAECVYWAGRYLERTEACARLLKVHTELFVDLPRSAGLTWSPLLAVTGSSDGFVGRYEGTKVATEDKVVRYLVLDLDNAGSMMASVAQARHNMRVTRGMFPRQAWEEVNELHLWFNDTCREAVDRRTRLVWTDGVIRRCQLLAGLISGAMTHDASYSFLEVGRYVERADMTTRVLDVQAGVLMSRRDDDPYADVTWLGVLRSVAAAQSFRARAPGGASGPAALRFLLKDSQFPRSVEHCLTEVSRALIELPNHEEPMAACARVQRMLEDVDAGELDGGALHRFVDQLQQGVAGVHDLVAASYFRATPTGSAVLAVR